MDYLLGIDIGTSGTKGVLMDIDSGLRIEIYGWALCFAHEDRKNLKND